MAARMNKILVIGGTAGIGEQLVRRFQSLGKKVIVTGRNGSKLDALKKELQGLETSKVGFPFPHASVFPSCGVPKREQKQKRILLLDYMQASAN